MPATTSAIPAMPSPRRRAAVRTPAAPDEPPDSWRRIREDLAMLRNDPAPQPVTVAPSRPTN